MDKYKQFEKLIKEAKSILIISHINPDGDALGSMSAMRTAIYNNFKKTADMVLFTKAPERYTFLPEITKAMLINDCDKSREYDLAITVDVAAEERTAEAHCLFKKAKHTVCIDHHVTNEGFGEFHFIDPKASSAGEVIYKILDKLNLEIKQDTAKALYVAILTDTGSFRYENTTPEVFEIVGDLLKRDLDPSDLYKKCYETKSKSIMLFQNYCLGKAVFEDDDKIAYTVIYKKDFEKFKVKEDATDGLPETLRSITSTEVAFSVKEIDDKVCKISMRSKNIDVSKICTMFNGGGHKYASGCTLKSTCQKATKKILEEIKKVL